MGHEVRRSAGYTLLELILVMAVLVATFFFLIDQILAIGVDALLHLNF